jgi:large subunit ribosomal protein L17
MRHKRLGRRLGRSSSHREAMFRNLASSLFLTERDPIFFEGLTQSDGKTKVSPPKHKGRVVTTLEKAKEVRALVERCITIAKKSLPAIEKAAALEPAGGRTGSGWKEFRKSPRWQEWNQAIVPVVNAKRRVFQLLRDKTAVNVLFETIAPRYVDRDGGYTRVVRLAQPRLGDAGTRAILELVGRFDRKSKKSEKPSFASEAASPSAAVEN